MKDYSLFELEMCTDQADFIKLQKFVKAAEVVQEYSVILLED